MRIGTARQLLGACVLAAGVFATPALAEDATYIGIGEVHGVQNVVPVEWLPALGVDAAQAKGQGVVDELGQLLGARMESPNLQIIVAANEGSEIFTLIVDHAGARQTYALTRVNVTIKDAFTVRGRIVGDGIEETFRLVLPDATKVDGDKDMVLPLGGNGIDVACSRLGLNSSGCGDDFAYYGTANGLRAFSMATTSCNIGNVEAEWISGSGARHPLIAQNLFQLVDGKFLHIGQSWLKHSFCAVSENTCGDCQGTDCDTLGIGCADTYWATLNDGQDGGAKSDILTFTPGNTHTHPYTTPNNGPTAIRGRLQVHDSDILNGGLFFAEAQYVTHDEPLNNRWNNASWRAVNVGLTSMSGVAGCQSSVNFLEPAIRAWEDNGATVREVTTPQEGADVLLGYTVNDNGDGTWTYVYAIQNLNSERSVGSFQIPIPDCANITNVGFHDVDYHSGEPYDATDWSVSTDGGFVRWETEDHGQNSMANAIRWGTMYSFWFDADMAPGTTSGTLGMFVPATLNTVNTFVDAPFGNSSPTPTTSVSEMK